MTIGKDEEMTDHLPPGLEYVRTTDVFDDEHHPAGLRRAHRVADGVWARLLVHTGELTFLFEDEPEHAISVIADEAVVIPPRRLHHVEIAGPVSFVLEFHRDPGHLPPDAGTESTGLARS
jgi:tellurite resistance-related uncharacterized protein